VPVELAGIRLTHLTGLATSEAARIARHRVPGMSGALAQALGRESVEVELRGIFYGASAPDDLDKLRTAYEAGDVVTFFVQGVDSSDLTQTLHFSDVLITALDVEQRAGAPDEFGFSCLLVEYVPPPPPATASALGTDLVDADVLDAAGLSIDGIGDVLGAISELGDLLGNIPSFGDPTTRIPEMLGLFAPLADGGAKSLQGVRDSLQPPA